MIEAPKKWLTEDALPAAPPAVWWCEGGDTYYIPAGAVDVEAALYLAFKAGEAKAYAEWAGRESHPFESDHRSKSDYYLSAARSVSGVVR